MKVRKTDFQMKNEGAVPMQKILLFTSIPLYFNFNIDGKIFSVFVSENIYRYNICTYNVHVRTTYVQQITPKKMDYISTVVKTLYSPRNLIT